MLVMTFTGYRQPDGSIHVQNSIGGVLGQHHAHTAGDFETWKAGKTTFPVRDEDITWSSTPCDCPLVPGEMTNGWPKKS